MGFHIPDSPRLPPTNRLTTSTGTDTSDAPSSFRDGFSSVVSRRRNAVIPVLSFDALGSPRSPHVCLTRDHRLALVQLQEQQLLRQHEGELLMQHDPHFHQSKAIPSVHHQSEQGAHTTDRSALNVYEIP